MNRLLMFALLILCSSMIFSCKKQVDDKKEDLIISVITDGVWFVDRYVENATDISGDFANYDFKFFKDGTVTGTKATLVNNGTWAGDAISYTITSNFPTGSDTLLKMNGIWKLTDSYIDYVEAEKTTPTGTNYLYLRKKP